jgi:hypothetical protein
LVAHLLGQRGTTIQRAQQLAVDRIDAIAQYHN